MSLCFSRLTHFSKLAWNQSFQTYILFNLECKHIEDKHNSRKHKEKFKMRAKHVIVVSVDKLCLLCLKEQLIYKTNNY